MNNGSNHDYVIELSGVPPDMSPAVEMDIRKIADCMARVAEELDIPVMLQRVQLTNNFEGDVNWLLEERSGFAGYTAQRENAHAVAKTIWTWKNQYDVGFSVIIDANHTAPWALSNPSFLVTLLHELSHVLRETLHLRRLGVEEYTATGDTRERWLERWASLILDEYKVDRIVDGVLYQIARNENGEPLSLRDIDERGGGDWVAGLLERLGYTPQFVDEKVGQFQRREIDIQTLAATAIPAVKDLLFLFSHTAARYLDTDLWPEIVAEIKNSEFGTRFFREHLDRIISQFGKSQVTVAESIQVTAEAVEGIFKNCGLSFETIPEGVYITVRSPLQAVLGPR